MTYSAWSPHKFASIFHGIFYSTPMHVGKGLKSSPSQTHWWPFTIMKHHTTLKKTGFLLSCYKILLSYWKCLNNITWGYSWLCPQQVTMDWSNLTLFQKHVVMCCPTWASTCIHIWTFWVMQYGLCTCIHETNERSPLLQCETCHSCNRYVNLYTSTTKAQISQRAPRPWPLVPSWLGLGALFFFSIL